jgi:hypothetical protein
MVDLLKSPGLRHNLSEFQKPAEGRFFIEIFKFGLDYIKITIDKINV